MTNKEILKIAINIAVENGFNKKKYTKYSNGKYYKYYKRNIIFTHEFARAFAKHIIKNDLIFVSVATNKFNYINNKVPDDIEKYIKDNYEYVLDCVFRKFLTELVLRKDNIKYLYQFLF